MRRTLGSHFFHKDTCLRVNPQTSIHWGFADDKTLEDVLERTIGSPGVVQPCGVCFKEEIEEYRKRKQ